MQQKQKLMGESLPSVKARKCILIHSAQAGKFYLYHEKKTKLTNNAKNVWCVWINLWRCLEPEFPG